MAQKGHFASMLRGFRDRATMTKSDLARAVGVKSIFSVSKWESPDRVPPPPTRVKAIAKALGLSHDERDALIDAAVYERAGVEFMEHIRRRRLRLVAEEETAYRPEKETDRGG